MVISSKGKILLLLRDIPIPEINDHISSQLQLKEIGEDEFQSISTTPIQFLKRGEFLIPGFLDTHNHAPQWAQRGTGRGNLIMDWLNKITFPHEAKFRDPDYAERVYSKCVDGFLNQGMAYTNPIIVIL